MSFECTQCHKILGTVQEIQECPKCGSEGRIAMIPPGYSPTDSISGFAGTTLGSFFNPSTLADGAGETEVETAAEVAAEPAPEPIVEPAPVSAAASTV